MTLEEDHLKIVHTIERLSDRVKKLEVQEVPAYEDIPGHIIQDGTTEFTQRAYLQFAGDEFVVTDDGLLGATVITLDPGRTPTSHSSLDDLDADDHAQYVHINTARTITAQHSFSPTSGQAPFALGANAQGQLVTGLYADSVNKTVTAGSGLTGGGALTGNITLDLNLATVSGLEIVTDELLIDLDTNSGLQLGAGGLSIDLDTDSGLSLGAGGLSIGAGTLITVSGSTVNVSNGSAQYQVPVTGSTPFTPSWTLLSSFAGSGLAWSTAFDINLATNSGLQIATDQLSIDLDTNPGLQLGAGGLSIDLETDSGLSLGAGGIALGTPSTVSLTSTNAVTGSSHSHAISASSNPGPSARILASNASGQLELEGLSVGAAVGTGLIRAYSATWSIGYTNLAEAWFLAGTTADGVGIDSNEIIKKGGQFFVGTGDANWLSFVADGQARASVRSDRITTTVPINKGVSSGTVPLHIRDTNQPQFRLDYNSTYWSSFNVDSAGTLTITSIGDLIVDPQGLDFYPSATFETNLGTSSNQWLTIHAAELYVGTLVSTEEIATTGGHWLVGTSTSLAVDLTAIATTITVKHNNLNSGDLIVMRARGNLEWMKVTSSATPNGSFYDYSVDRDEDLSGANVWNAGDTVFNSGQTGTTWINAYAAGTLDGSSAGPTVAGIKRASATYNDYDAIWALGDLNTLYGYASTTIGVGLGDYAGGEYVTIDETNGIKLYGGGAQKVHLSNAGLLYLGDTSNEHVEISATAVYIKDGATTLTTVGAGEVYLGDTSIENIKISSAGIQIRDGVTVEASWLGDVITLGEATGERVVINGTTGIEMYGSTTKYVELTSAGVLTLGDSGGGEYAVIQSTGLEFYGGGTKYVDLSSTGVLTLGTSGDTQITIDTTNGVQIKNPAGTTLVQLDASGNVIFGRVTDDNANVYWNSGNQRLEFRGSTAGTVVQSYIDTDGAFVSGGGAITIDGTDGLSITSGVGNPNLIKWYSGANLVAYQSGFINIGVLYYGIEAVAPDASTPANIVLNSAPSGAGNAGSNISISAPANSDAVTENSISLSVDAVTMTFWESYLSVPADVRIGSGLYVGSVSTDPAAGNVVATADILAGGGMYVGGTSANPGTGILIASDDIVAGGGIYSGSVLGTPSTGDVVGTGDFLVGAGMVIGSTAVNPASGELRVSGGIVLGTTAVAPTSGGIRASGGAVIGNTGVTPTTGVIQATSDIKNGGAMYVGSATGTTIGTGSLILDQGENDTIIMQMRSSDVAHGMTDLSSTDTYFSAAKLIAASGGALIYGYSEVTQAIQISGAATTDGTLRSTSAIGAIGLQARKKSGTTVGNMGSNANLVVIYNNVTARALFDAEGDLHLDATLSQNSWDDKDDMKLLTGLRASVMDPKHELVARSQEWIEYAKPILEATGVITYNEDGHHFVAMKQLQWLQIDAMRQLDARDHELAAKNRELEARLEKLERLLLEADNNKKISH